MKKGFKIVFLPVVVLCLVAVLFACTKTTYTVTFNSNGGSDVAPIEKVAKDSTVTLPTPPTKEGNDFGGWYFDNNTFEEEFTESTKVTDNITVYAKWTATPHVHDLVHHAAVAATCDTAGTIEYWSCSSCDKKYSDAAGQTEVTNIIVAAGHTLVHNAAVAPTCEAAGTVEYWSCSVCNKKFSDAAGKTEITNIVDPAKGHTLVHHPAVAATCDTAGTIEYWSCSVCNKKFSDAAGVKEITNIVAPAGHKLTHHAAVAPTCEAAGTIEYWNCSVCDKNYSDAAGTTEVTNLVAPALTHDYVFTRTVAPDAVNQVDGYDLYTCSHDSSHTEKRNTVEWETLVHSVVLEFNGGALAEGFTEYIEGLETALPNPTRTGFVFYGWFDNEALSGSYVTKIGTTENTDLKFYARWIDENVGVATVYVGPTRVFKTILEGVAAVAINGSIHLDAGIYEGASINKSGVSLYGPNKDIYPTATNRVAEAVLTGDLNLLANGITINGIQLSGLGRIIGGPAGVEDITITNVHSYTSTINPTSAASTTAPIYFYSAVAGVEYKNIVLSNLVYGNSKGRPMIFYGAQINGLSITNSIFVGSKTNYNDGIKIDNTANWGIKGNVTITGNHFEGFDQYTIWFRQFSEGNYVIENNTFKNCGNTAANHAAANFIAYVGGTEAESKVDISFQYNSVTSSFMLFRLDKSDSLTESMLTAKVNNNKLYSSEATHYIKNSMSYSIDGTNNYYDVVPVEGKFLGTTWSPYHADEASVPAYPGVSFMYDIVYELDGGAFEGAYVNKYNSNTGLTEFPVPKKENYIFGGWYVGDDLCEAIPALTTGTVTLTASWIELGTTEYQITYEYDFGSWVTRDAISKDEVVEALFSDYFEWAVKYDNYKGTYEAFCKGADGKYQSGYWYTTINGKMRNATSKLVDDTGENAYFWNTPDYYYKWAAFFEAFDAAMLGVNASQSFYKDTYAAMIRIYEFADWTSKAPTYFNAHLPAFYKATQVPQTPVTSYYSGVEVPLINLYDDGGRIFLGWYDKEGEGANKVTSISATSYGDKTFYARWEAEVLAEEIVITNIISELERYKTHQLIWNFAPVNTTDQRVEFLSSDDSILSVSPTGMLTARKNGQATITIKAIGGNKKTKSMVINVYSPEHFELSYETDSYVLVDGKIDLNAKYFRRDGSEGTLAWSSLNPTIASVDANGKVTGLATGVAFIRVMADDDAELYKDFAVTVINAAMSGAVKEILAAHQSNVLIKYDFGVGAGVPVYYADIYGSVSNLLFEDFSKDTTYLAKGNAKDNHGGEMTSIEFITIHYTGNMNAGANAASNAGYFVDNASVSIHYTVGNDGVFHCLDDKYGAYHAGDSASNTYVGLFEWLPTGVDYNGTDLINDLLNINVTASNDAYYEINGVKTTIKLPATYDYNSRGTNYAYNSDGTITSGSRTAPIESFFTDSGFRFKVEDGKYYMAKTWWCYTQVYEGRICSVGGNRNSVGIESCVDKGSDLWYTWQKLAQLVAQLVIDHNLDITRAVMHNFFTSKDCHQPFLANNMELWYVFMDMLEHEYNLLKNFAEYQFALTTTNPLVASNGRITSSDDAEILTYTITVTNPDGSTEQVTLGSAVNGIYSK
ncbi:InlB B-repeat-containing protein [Acholeplasma sp. OttesenSCG-928-E16]|nr:InlB B-repeat-containing protein [Acholeplasma sp. OttesenSCG-928-E16]